MLLHPFLKSLMAFTFLGIPANGDRSVFFLLGFLLLSLPQVSLFFRSVTTPFPKNIIASRRKILDFL